MTIIHNLGKLKLLLDCPICEKVDKVYLRLLAVDGDEYYSIGCNRCEIDTYNRHSLGKATEHWIQLGVTRFYGDRKGRWVYVENEVKP